MVNGFGLRSRAQKLIGLQDIKDTITKAISKALPINFLKAKAITAQLLV